MKLSLGIALAAILIAGTAGAQQLNFGIKGGVNLYNIDNDNTVTYNMRTGFHAGLLWHLHVDQNFAIQPELVYSVQGIKFSGNDNLSLGYLNVPVMFQLMFNNGFRLEAGPQVGFLVNAKTEVDGNNEDVKDSLEELDFALGVGIGYISPSGFGMDARYNYGLSNINKSDLVTSTNRGYQLGVFYQFSHR